MESSDLRPMLAVERGLPSAGWDVTGEAKGCGQSNRVYGAERGRPAVKGEDVDTGVCVGRIHLKGL